MHYEAIYGLPESDADHVAEQLSQALSLPFEKRNSLYYGDYCLYPPFKERHSVEGKIRVYLNDSAAEEHEPEFPECKVLVYAYLPKDNQESLRERLQELFPEVCQIRMGTHGRQWAPSQEKERQPSETESQYWLKEFEGVEKWER